MNEVELIIRGGASSSRRSPDGADDERALAPAPRILVVARPAEGRLLEGALAPAGYEIHRSPGSTDVIAVARALKPAAAVISFALPWLDPLGLAVDLMAGPTPIPALLLGAMPIDPRAAQFPWLPVGARSDEALTALARLLASDHA